MITSQRVRQYKPNPGPYHAAHTIAGPSFVHVAASARDVRGALQAGVDTIRLIRPRHDIDPAGPRPTPRSPAWMSCPTTSRRASRRRSSRWPLRAGIPTRSRGFTQFG